MNGVPTRYGGGIAILGAAHTAVLKTLDNLVVRWAVNAGAEEILPPPIHAVADLVKFDVYTNFPHLSLVAGPLRTDPPTKPHGGQFTSHQILPAGLGLPIATCFGVYLFLEDRRVTDDLLITLSNRCFRSEDYFDGLRRLLTFQMREIVAVGSYEHTQRHLERFTTKIENLAERLSLNMVKRRHPTPFSRRRVPEL